MIRFDGVTRKYGTKVAVTRLDLEVRAGEVFAFLGPNGAGKTTTIRMLVGLLRPTAGWIRVCGCDTVKDTREATRFLGYVPDEAYLYEKLSGREFLEFVAEMRGLSRAERADRVERESRRFELSGFLDDLIETYSHGMQQRLVFASALLHDPPVLVVDEPTVGLDPRGVRLVKDLIRQRVAAGSTVFMSTHTLDIAEEIADRIGIIHRGCLNFVGTLDELRSGLAAQHRSLEHLFLEVTAGDDHQGKSPAPVSPSGPSGAGP
jgi:ABC-2 type transport system ATP-binding protein